MKKTEKSRRNGFTLLEILLALTIVGIIAAFTIGISYSIRNMTKVNSTKSRMEQIAVKAKAFYRNTGDVPVGVGSNNTDVPVGTSYLNMEQKFRLDAWGQYFYYIVGPHYAANPGIQGITVTGNQVYGLIVSAGPNQTIDSFNTSTFPLTNTTFPEGGTYTQSDDVYVPINVSQEAGEMALEELKVLQSKVKALDALYAGINNGGGANPDDTYTTNPCEPAEPTDTSLTGCPPTSGLTNDPNCGTATLDQIDSTSVAIYGCAANTSALDAIVTLYSLADPGYRTDPWGNDYVWGQSTTPPPASGTQGPPYPTDNDRYHKFFSMGPDGYTSDTTTTDHNGDGINDDDDDIIP